MNNERTLELRQVYAREFSQWAPQERQKLIFLDECGFNLHLTRSHARSKKGSRAHVVVPTVKGRNVTLIAAINNCGVLHHQIVTNANVNAERFKQFMTDLFEKISSEPDLENSFIIMDNARIHKSNEIKNFLLHCGHNIKFLPPYSPMLNPIENAFSKIKSHARAIMADISTEHNISDVINRSVLHLNQNDCSNYIMDMVLKIPMAMEMQHLH